MTQHVVISGWNIAIVVGFIGVIGRRFRSRHRLLWFTASLAAVALYSFAVGADPTVVRAAIMGAGGLIAPLLRRRADPLVWLALASAILTLVHPTVVTSLSFLLSCAATFGVIVVAPWLSARFARFEFTQRVPWLTEAVAVTLGASLMTEPLILHAFGRISLISPLVNIVVEPLVPPIMALGFVTALLSFFPFALPASVAGLCTAMPAWLFLTIIRWAGAFPAAAPQIPQPGLLATIALYCVVIVVALPVSMIRVMAANARGQIIELRGSNGTLYAATFLVTLVIAISILRLFA